MAIGYACIAIGVPDSSMSKCLLRSVTDEKLRRITSRNLSSLENIVDYNIRQGIGLFRISSDVIPFGSHSANMTDWKNEFASDFKRIGEKIRSAGMRVSMHPGQYTVLNSISGSVVENAIRDLGYHALFLDSLGTGIESKIVIHIGGVYGDREIAKLNFSNNYFRLSPDIRDRIVIENDEKNFSVSDALDVSRNTGAPVVFDNLHHRLKPSFEGISDFDLIDICAKTWRKSDGNQKVHYSQQNTKKNPGAHSDTIIVDEFIGFQRGLGNRAVDIMLEVKDKNLSAVKCICCTSENASIGMIEREWARYKYLVLSKSNSAYNEIRLLLRGKAGGRAQAVDFYRVVERALLLAEDSGAELNGAMHVWGYIRGHADRAEKTRYEKLVMEYTAGKSGIGSLKRFLHKCAAKYDEKYLLDSLYFWI
jgi:UV DNA damage endonuclease